MRTAQQAADPVVRQPRTIAETVKAGIPGLSESVEPRITRFGEAATREGGPLRRAADPFNVSSVVQDPVAGELQRLGVQVTLPSAAVAVPGELTRPQETDAKQRRGRAVRQALKRLMADPRYTPLNDAGRVRAIDRLLSRVRSDTSTALRREGVAARVGQTYQHPQYGPVQVVGTDRQGQVVVRRVGSPSPPFLVRAGDLTATGVTDANAQRIVAQP